MPILRDVLSTFVRAGLHRLGRRRLPQTTGQLRLSGLTAAVEVLRDRWGVPHIYARNQADLFFAQGFVHAQERLWQMEFQRRLVAGRLSEVFGQATVATDRWLRILGLRRVAEQESVLLDAEGRTVLEAYVAGVNAGIGRGPLPVEFALLRYQPEPWTAADSLSWAKMMAWSLSVNWEAELARALLIARVGPELAAELEPEYRGDLPTIVPSAAYEGLGDSALRRASAARPFAGPPAHAGVGSNSWVLAGRRTATGRPLLANDMHLLMSIPAIWYENHLVSRPSDSAEPEFAVTGVTFPGIPGVVAGHNQQVAWGFTNGFADVQDLYIEHLRRHDGRVQYAFRGEWHDAAVIREEIRVKGQASVVEEVIVTRHGPIINSLAPDLIAEARWGLDRVGVRPPEDGAELPLALRWTALEPDATFRALLGMNRARSCAEFRDALRHWAGPVQNVVYADVHGDIGYSFPGRIPIRSQGDGRLPVPGWTGEYEWLGYVPFDELPHLANPPQGYVVTANNRVVGPEYPYWLGRDFAMGDRAGRIVELIEAQELIDISYIRRMHFDQVSLTARAIGRHLADLTPHLNSPELAQVAASLRDWDGHLAADSSRAAVQQVFMRQMLDVLLSNKLGEAAARRYMGQGPTPVLAETSILGHRSWEWLRHLLEHGEEDADWYNLAPREAVLSGMTFWNTRAEAMAVALDRTVRFLKSRLGPEPRDWAWGGLHKLLYAHVLGRVPVLAPFFNRGPYAMGGDGTTIWATGAGFHTVDGSGVIGPPFRFIADVGDWDRCLGLLAPGQSGHPASPHYDDQIEAWFTGEYHPMFWERASVEQAVVERLRLEP